MQAGSGAMVAVWRSVVQPLSKLQHPSCLEKGLITSAALTNSCTAGISTCTVYEDDQHSIHAERIPAAVLRTMQQLRAAGHSVWLVGGAVRDLLLGIPPKDYDLLTSAQLTQVKQLADKPRIIGRTFPICQVVLNGVRVEVSSLYNSTSHRAHLEPPAAGIPPDAANILWPGSGLAAASKDQGDRSVRNKRPTRPQQQQQQPVSWAGARRQNALGRDFTVNSLLYDPFDGLLFDYTGGMADLSARVLRCLGPPDQRFTRDPACMLRAVRCASRAGLSIEPTTLAALQQHAQLISSLNTHRLTAELQALLGYGAAAAALRVLEQTQLLQFALPLLGSHLLRQHQQRQRRQGFASVASAQEGTECKMHVDAVSCDSRVSNTSTVTEQTAPFTWDPASLPSQADNQTPPHVTCVRPDEQQAASALGRLWSKISTVQQPRQPSAGAEVQHQSAQVPYSKHTRQLDERQQHLHLPGADEGSQQAYACLLLRVLDALDSHVDVARPAPADVILACLTVPLLVESLNEAAQQLQQLSQSKKQQQEQQEQQQQQHQAAVFDLQQACMFAGDQQHHPEQDRHADVIQVYMPSVGQLLHTASEAGVLLLRQQPPACAIARPFSSSSSSPDSADSRQLPPTPDSTQPLTASRRQRSRTPASPLCDQLLQGAVVADCIQQEAERLMRLVCQPGTAQCVSGGAMQLLFGAHAPRTAADLLLHRMQAQPQKQQQQQIKGLDVADTQHAAGRQPKHRTRSAQKSSSRQHLDLWDEYAAALPRSNKQFRQLMQQQWDRQLQQAQACFGAALTPGSLVMAGTDAGHVADSSSKARCYGADDGADSEVVYSKLLMHKVLKTAGLDLNDIKQRLMRLQVSLVSPN